MKENKQIRHWDFPDILYTQMVDYVEKKEVPVHFSPSQAVRFKRKCRHFVTDNGELFLVVLRSVVGEVKLKVIRDSEKEHYMQKEWRDLAGGALGSGEGLYSYMCQKYVGVTRKDCVTFVGNQEVRQLKSTQRKSIVVKPIVKDRPYDLWCFDLIDMQAKSGANSNIHWLLICIDHFSKFAWVRPMTSKALAEVAWELKKIVYEEGQKPAKFLSDNEFREKKEIVDMCEELGIEQKLILPYTPESNGCAERFVGTIKRKIATYLSQNETERYVDVLPSLLYTYNNTRHSATGYTPTEVHRLGRGNTDFYFEVKKNLLRQAHNMIRKSHRQLERENNDTSPLGVDDKVRVSIFALTEGKKIKAGVLKIPARFNLFTEHIYTVTEVVGKELRLEAPYVRDDKEVADVPVRYRVENEDGNPPQRAKELYWRHELLKIDEDKLVRKEKIDLNAQGIRKFNATRRTALMSAKVIREAEIAQREEKHEREEERKAEVAHEKLIVKTHGEERKDVAEAKRVDLEERKAVAEAERAERKEDTQRKRREREEAETYEVEKVVSHRINSVARSKGRLVFEVKWLGFDASENTWEPEANFVGALAKRRLTLYKKKNKIEK